MTVTAYVKVVFGLITAAMFATAPSTAFAQDTQVFLGADNVVTINWAVKNIDPGKEEYLLAGNNERLVVICVADGSTRTFSILNSKRERYDRHVGGTNKPNCLAEDVLSVFLKGPAQNAHGVLGIIK